MRAKAEHQVQVKRLRRVRRTNTPHARARRCAGAGRSSNPEGSKETAELTSNKVDEKVKNPKELLDAAYEGDEAKVTGLLARGADANAVNANSMSARMRARVAA